MRQKNHLLINNPADDLTLPQAIDKTRHVDLKENKLYIDGIKTKAAKRYVPIPDHLVDEFKERNCKPFEYLSTKQNGEAINSQ